MEKTANILEKAHKKIAQQKSAKDLDASLMQKIENFSNGNHRKILVSYFKRYIGTPLHKNWTIRFFTGPTRRLEYPFPSFIMTFVSEKPVSGKQLLKLLKKTNLRVKATWANQSEMHPSTGTALNWRGRIIRDQNESWVSGLWEWHRTDEVKKDTLYDHFIFITKPSAKDYGALLEVIESLKLIQSTEMPKRKK